MPARGSSETTRILIENPTLCLLYHAWCKRQNDARVILERIMPQFLAHSKLLPSVYTVEVVNEVLILLDAGDIPALRAIFASNQILYDNAIRALVEKRRADEKLAMSNRKIAIATNSRQGRKEHHAL